MSLVRNCSSYVIQRFPNWQPCTGLGVPALVEDRDGAEDRLHGLGLAGPQRGVAERLRHLLHDGGLVPARQLAEQPVAVAVYRHLA